MNLFKFLSQCIALLAATGVVPTGVTPLRQRESDEPATVIERTFRSQLGEIPQLGWFLSDGRFVAGDSRPSLTLYAAAGDPTSAKLIGSLNSTEVTAIRRRERVACDVPEDVPLNEYSVATGKHERMALYTSRPFSETRAGRVPVPLSQSAVTEIAKLLGWTVPDRVKRQEAFAIAAGSHYYSFHRRFDVVSGILRQEALVLHDPTGRVVAHELTTLRENNICDGCGLPTLKQGTSFRYQVLNLFSFAGFPYPVLLLDTSTVEGRALSLLTFTSAGRLSEFRLYEYVVNCSPTPDYRARGLPLRLRRPSSGRGPET